MKKLKSSNRVRKTLQGRSRGFSILEVVIAIALLGIIGVSVLSALQTAALAFIIADRRATAESLARTQMEYVRYSPYEGDPAEGPPQYDIDPQIETTLPPDFTVDTTAIRLNKDVDPNDDDGIQEITVTVSHDGRVVVTLEDYKRELDT